MTPSRRSRFGKGEKLFGVVAIFAILLSIGGMALTVWLIVAVINFLQAHS
jgi:hypothetical protein